MSSEIVQANYEQLDAIARQFGARAEAIGELRSVIQRTAQPLEQGGWQGRGAEAFFAELTSTIYPAMQRLRQALSEARAVTLEASAILRTAEQEAGALFRGEPVAGTAFAGATAGATAGAGGSGGGVLGSIASLLGRVGGGIKDFATGMYGEAKDMVVGLTNLVRHPIETAKGIGYAITHPGEFWDGFKQPYVEAWANGRPWEAIGRGTMFALSFALGAKGADKAAKAAGLGSKAGRAGEIAGTAGRGSTLSRILKPLGAVGQKRGIASEIAQGLTTRREASFLRKQLKELADTDIVYGSSKARNGNFFDSRSNQIHLRSGSRQQPRGMFYEEIQHALDNTVNNGALNDLRNFGFHENPVLANLRLHAGTFRRMAENPLFKLSPGERARLIEQAIKWEQL